ncbi:hypothetical protein B0A52_09596 [Exophiala mesophila]|uniref:Uncharacterized protein n=1 Tax=Exophiala mesophila TaxID=212818 RepID=A0A438MT49_EXOME|nr:hypothetical protein B0A52_09596 [Exophiala mesophila]
MDVLSVEACVQAVVSAYRDATKLVQRLKDKQSHGQDFILPDDLTKEFEDSLQLGGLAIQSQYDHDVRRFGETYARGDSTGREQMKDILITLQQAVISHLREVYMDDAALNLHALKETSDDCRVNATVCLGQLYQRMSSATAAVKQSSKPYIDSTDPLVPPSLAYSSSRSTHSSFGGQPYDAQSSASYNTYSSKTATEFNPKPAPRPAPQRRISLTSAVSYSSEIRTRGEDNVLAVAPPMSRQVSQGQVSSSRTQRTQVEEDDRTSLPSSPPPYVPSPAIQTSDEKGQKFPPSSSFYQAPTKTVGMIASQPLSTRELRGTLDQNAFPTTNSIQPIHELDITSPPNLPRPGSDPSSPGAALQAEPRRVSLNQIYNTQEYVESLDKKSRPPAELLASREYQQYLQQLQMQPQYRMDPLLGHTRQNEHPYKHAADLHDQTIHQPNDVETDRHIYNDALAKSPRPSGGSLLQSSLLAQHVQQQNLTHARANKDDDNSSNSPTSPTGLPSQAKMGLSRPRPLSIRSTSSTSSKIASFALRKGLPPGIAEAIQKPAPSAHEQAIHNKPRYVRPQSLIVAQDTPKMGLTSPWPVDEGIQSPLEEEKTQMEIRQHSSLESTMRFPGSTSLQISRSELNLPGESNLAGFCKGAVRHQLGARKKGFGVEHKKGSKGVEYFMKCTKCNFEGPASVSKALPSGGRAAAKVEKTPDNRVRVAEGGIKYRWNFLAKSHVLNRGNVSDLKNSNDIYGCYFCCAEGAAKGWFDNSVNLHLATLGGFGEGTKTTAVTTPTFNGLDAFMEHLVSHRLPGRTPGLIVANEMNCIIGRTAHDSEDFDLNLPALTS